MDGFELIKEAFCVSDGQRIRKNMSDVEGNGQMMLAIR